MVCIIFSFLLSTDVSSPLHPPLYGSPLDARVDQMLVQEIIISLIALDTHMHTDILLHN